MNYKCSSVSYCGKIKTLAHNQNNVPCLRGGGEGEYTQIVCMECLARDHTGQEEYVRGTIPGTVQFLGIARVDFQAVPILNNVSILSRKQPRSPVTFWFQELNVILEP